MESEIQGIESGLQHFSSVAHSKLLNLLQASSSSSSFFLKFVYNKFFLKVGVKINIFERKRQRKREQGRGRERGGDTECEAGSRLRAVITEPDAELKLTTCEIVI